MGNKNKMINQLPPLCACGCGSPVKWSKRKKDWNKYILGHNKGMEGKSSNKKGKTGIYSKETLQKMSLAKSGPNHPNYGKFGKETTGYKNGFTFNKIIAKQFLESKNYTCERCGFCELPEDVLSGNHLRVHSHHIIPREDAPEKINELSNLCCLCVSCHTKYHMNNINNINKNSLMKFLNFI